MPCLKKTVQNCFRQSFAKFPPIFDTFWQKDGKEAKIMRAVLILKFDEVLTKTNLHSLFETQCTTTHIHVCTDVFVGE